MNYTVEKQLVETYTISSNGLKLARIILDSDGSFGASGELGIYSTWWNAKGDDLKRLLIRISDDSDYLLNRLSSKSKFMKEETFKEWVDKLHEIQFECNLSDEETFELIEYLESAKGYCDNGEELRDKFFNHYIVKEKIDEPYFTFYAQYDYPPKAIHFVEIVMPLLADILKKELEDK